MATIFCQTTVFAQNPFTIVLDAGHGGKDPGAVNGKNYEKTINLEVVLCAGKILEKNPNFKVVYTRSTDVFIELSERSAIAAKAKADLFVSVHTNSAASTAAIGTETYVMGVHKSDDNLNVAMRENGVISLEDNFSQKYEGYDPNSSESHIMFSLMQYGYTQESLNVAFKVQESFSKLGRKDKGVKQAGFLVLWRNSMPSILTELGFITNPSEMNYLISKKGQSELGAALAQSITEYWQQNVKSSVKFDSNTSSKTTPESLPKTQPQTAPRSLESLENEYRESTGVYYAIQVKSSKKAVEINSMNFGPLVMQIQERKVKNLYKYTLGDMIFYKEALHLQKKIRRYFSDAFIVAFDRDGNQVTVSEAKKILKDS